MSEDKAISSNHSAGSFSYAAFTFEIDSASAIAVPIGVALWSPEKQWVDFRLVGPREHFKQFRPKEHLPFVRHVDRKIRQWIESRRLPYGGDLSDPCSDDWWRHLRSLLIHRMRLSEPRSIDCHDPEEELAPLYESVVSASRSPREQRVQVQREIRRCLKGVTEKFSPAQPIPGFGGRPVKVGHSYHGSHGWVLVEGVNLASSRAEAEADSAVSRLMRLKEGFQEPHSLLVAYLASPEGLNGERVLVDWMRVKTNAEVFDLVQDRERFQESVRRTLNRAEGTEGLF